MRARSVVVSFLALAFLLTGSIAPAQEGVTFEGLGSSRALDLSIPALQGLDQPLIGGFSAAATTVDFASTGVVTGAAAGLCDFFSGDLDTANCTSGTYQESNISNPGDASAKDCLALIELPASPPVLGVGTACGNSHSAFSNGAPTAVNEAGIATTSLALDLTGIDPAVEDLKDTIVGDVSDLLGEVFGVTPDEEQLTQLEESLLEILDQIKDDPNFRAMEIELGAGSSNVVTTDGAIEVTSKGGGLAIRLLGVQPLEENALITISISEATSTAAFDTNTGKATSSAAHAGVTVEIKNILGLPDVTDLTAVVPLGTVLGLLEGTLLETEIEIGSAENSAAGGTASASTSAVRVHALKGIGDPDTEDESLDGGILLRIASTDVSITGALPDESTVTPVTGWPTAVYMAIAVGGIALAVGLRRFAKRIHPQT